VNRSARRGRRRALKRGQEISQQHADRTDLIFEPVIRIEYVQRRPMLFRPADAVAHRHDIIVPAVHYGRGSGHILRRVLFQTGHVESRRQQKQGRGPEAARGRGGHMAAHAGTHEHDRP